ncbi:MAG: hypothetical protein MR012_06585 [Roseburia sp.]|nr:hypothetical protein [Roseburia sp.]
MEEQKRYTDRFLRTEKIEKYKKKSKLFFLSMPYLSTYLCESLDFFKVGILDKMNIVSEKQVQGRYYSAGHLVIPTGEEIGAVLERVEEYISLTDDKSNKEYGKFTTQRSKFEKDMDTLSKKNYEEFSYLITVENDLSFFYPCTDLSFISNVDIKDIISIKFNASPVEISKQGTDMKISIKLAKENLLTFSEAYDTFKSQEGSSDT